VGYFWVQACLFGSFPPHQHSSLLEPDSHSSFHSFFFVLGTFFFSQFILLKAKKKGNFKKMSHQYVIFSGLFSETHFFLSFFQQRTYNEVWKKAMAELMLQLQVDVPANLPSSPDVSSALFSPLLTSLFSFRKAKTRAVQTVQSLIHTLHQHLQETRTVSRPNCASSETNRCEKSLGCSNWKNA
jgi:hypothetical protein